MYVKIKLVLFLAPRKEMSFHLVCNPNNTQNRKQQQKEDENNIAYNNTVASGKVISERFSKSSVQFGKSQDCDVIIMMISEQHVFSA